MVNALTHSRPPSYKSHISDHPIIESGGNNTDANVTNAISGGTGNNSVRSGGGPRVGSSSISGHHPHHQSQVQVAQVQVHPRTSPDHHSVVHSVVGSNQRLTADPASGQDISIVPVSSAAPHKSVVGEFNSKSDLKNDPDFHHHHYHIKIGENGHHQDLCDVDTASDYELFDNNGKKAEEAAEKRSVVTIVQTSTTNSSPVIVTVSGSAIGESEGSGSEFSDIRASPAEVEILATL